MSLSDLPVETAGNDIASARVRAVDAVPVQARDLLADTQDKGAVHAQHAVADAPSPDQGYSHRAHADLAKRDAGFQRYLDWEVGLVAQLAREGDVGIRLVEPRAAVAS